MGGSSTVNNAMLNPVTNNTVTLARLAVDTGGRYTERTNDLALGLARAQRDLTCGYVLGFYVDDAVDDKVTRIGVHVERPGLRAVHASKHVFRSQSVKLESKLRAAWFAPELFETGVVQAHAFPVRPASKKAWETLLTVSFPIPLEMLAAGRQTREFGAIVLDGQQVVHRFTRRLTVQPENTDALGLPRITFLEPITLEPGSYTLKVVMSDPGAAEPHATVTTIEVPEIPRRELFLVGPILARTAGPNLVVLGSGDGDDRAGNANTFEPLLVQMIDEPQDLLALTQACAVGKHRKGDTAISRALLRPDGELVGALPAVDLQLEGEGKVRCQNLLDVLPRKAIDDGDYVFEARLGKGDDAGARAGRIRFAVGAGSDDLLPAR